MQRNTNKKIKSFRILKIRFWRTYFTLEQDQKQYFNQVKLRYLKTKLQLSLKVVSEEESQNKQPKEGGHMQTPNNEVSFITVNNKGRRTV